MPILLIYLMFTLQGPQWDIMVRSLLGKTVVNYLTHNTSANSVFVGEGINNLLFYFEPYREPVSIIAFSFLSFFLSDTIFPYVLIAYAFYAFAIYAMSKELKLDILIAFAVFLNVFFASLLFLVNGGEALSISFAMLAIVYLLRKSPKSGVFLALAMLSKYPAITLLPLIFLLGDKKKIAMGLVLEAVVLSFWSAFDYTLFGNPFFSYTASISYSNVTAGAVSIDPIALLEIFAYPVIFGLIAVFAAKISKQKIEIKPSYTAMLVAAIIFLSALEAIVIVPHNDALTQARYSYLLVLGLLLPPALLLNRASKKMPGLRYLVSGIAIIALFGAIYVSYTTLNTPKEAYYSASAPNGVYTHAYNELVALGFSNCRFTTNAWVPMLYLHYDAYSPFYTPYAKSALQYPIIDFKYVGVQSSFILGLNQSKLAYTDGNVSIYLPQNVSCYKDFV